MLQSGGTAGVARYYSDGPANWYGGVDAFADGASDPFGAGGTGTGTLSVYAAYVEANELAHAGRTTVGSNPSGRHARGLQTRLEISLVRLRQS